MAYPISHDIYHIIGTAGGRHGLFRARLAFCPSRRSECRRVPAAEVRGLRERLRAVHQQRHADRLAGCSTTNSCAARVPTGIRASACATSSDQDIGVKTSRVSIRKTNGGAATGKLGPFTARRRAKAGLKGVRLIVVLGA